MEPVYIGLIALGVALLFVTVALSLLVTGLRRDLESYRLRYERNREYDNIRSDSLSKSFNQLQTDFDLLVLALGMEKKTKVALAQARFVKRGAYVGDPFAEGQNDSL